MGTLAPVPRICGREAEIQVLGEALDRVAAGGPAIVLVEGEAGIGKTRLLAQDLEEELALAGPVVLGLDDLQLADPSSLLTLGALARRLTGLAVGVIGCVRP